jgi:hypothetical protein
VRAPKTDDPHSLPRVDDLLDDIPVQQEPGRYSDRERVADYLASAQGVEFHDLNDDAQREWLMRASDALRAVWSIGRLTDPVQRESEDRITRPGGWHGMMMLTDAAYRSGYEYRKAEFAPVPSVGLRDRIKEAIGPVEAYRRAAAGEIPAELAVLSVLHEAGTQEDGLDALARQFKNGQTVVWGDGPHQQGTVVGFCYTIPEQAGGPDRPALVVKDHWSDRTGHVLPSELIAAPAVSGTPDTKEDEA